MSVPIGVSCGHAMRLIDINDVPLEGEPWTLYPLINEHPIELGDEMTCIVCNTTQIITGIYAERVTITSEGMVL